MRKILITLCVVMLVFGMVGSAMALTITAMDNAQNLAQAMLGTGITISNVTYTGANVASGYFTGGTAAGIGMESGIVLTSGFASHLNGNSNTADNITGDNDLAGDPMLDALVPGYTTYDATILEFDFVSSLGGDVTYDVYFQYVFGSEEYNEFVGSEFNDVFGFFLDGTNIALIPGTTTPVAINNVNNGYESTPPSYPEYYNNNDPTDGPPPFAFEYDGFTDVLTASFKDLVGTHHIRLAIADAGDYFLDSGVFLKANSFSDQPPEPPIPEPSTLLLFGAGLIGLLALGRKKLLKQ